MYKKYKFILEGLISPSGFYRLQKHLKKTDGIRNVSVNLASASLLIEFNPEKISISQIEEVIKAMGYHLVAAGTPLTPGNYERKLKIMQLKSRSEGRRIIIGLIFFIPLLLAGLSPLLHYSLPDPIGFQLHPGDFALFQLFLSIPIILIGWSLIRNGWQKLLILRPNVYSLITLSVTASIGYSIYSLYYLIWRDGIFSAYPLYFLPACAIILMSLVGRYVEKKITAKSDQALYQLFSILPATALLIKDGTETQVQTDSLTPGDFVKIKPATHIPVDGIVRKGMSMVEEGIFTGNNNPLLRSQNDKVLAGMYNQEGYLIVEVLKTGKETFLAEIIRLIEEGENSKPTIGHLADKVSTWVIQAILLIACISAGLWMFFTHNYQFAFNVFISVLMIACPVAIGLAIPISVLFATRKASSLSIMIRHISGFEGLRKASTYIFNMNGTITKGIPTVTDIIANQNLSAERLLQLAASAESLSNHPLAISILNDAREKNITILPPDPVRELPGQGIEAAIDDIRVDIGNRKLMELININPDILDNMSLICKTLSTQGKSALMIAVDGVLEGIIAVEDKPRPEARSVVLALQQKGYEIILLTGDHWNTAWHIAHEVGIKEVVGEIQPTHRARFVRKLQQEGKLVVMIGDGLNDAGALAQADVGIAIGSPNDIAADAADIVLLNKDLRLLLVVKRLANKTIRNIKENIFFAFLYNLLMVPIAGGLLYLFKIPFLLDPLWAVIVMFSGTLSVLLNGFRLQYFKK